MNLPKPYYEREGIAIYHGDCRDLLPLIDSVDHVITDPPYGVSIYQRMRNADSSGGNRRLSIKNESGLVEMKSGAIGMLDDALVAAVCDGVARITQRWLLVFSDAESTWLWRDALTAAGTRYVRTGAWLKPDSMPQMTGDRPGVGFELCTIAHAMGAMRWNGGGHPAVWSHNIVKGSDRPDHPCPKPLSLMRELVELFTDPGDLILDPFGGSMTTAVAAFQLHRRCICIELEEKWCEVGAKRIEALTPPLPLFEPEKATQEALL